MTDARQSIVCVQAQVTFVCSLILTIFALSVRHQWVSVVITIGSPISPDIRVAAVADRSRIAGLIAGQDHDQCLPPGSVHHQTSKHWPAEVIRDI